VALAIVSALVLLAGALFAFGWWQFRRIDKVAVASLSGAGGQGTNYLIVGSDSRQGIDPQAPDAGAFLGEAVSGERTDTIMVLRMQGSGSALLSIPRDLWVKNPVTGEMGRINSVYHDGPAALVQAVRNLGIPVQHYVEIDFVSFAKLVDAVGGITVEFPHPARDTHSGLDVPTAGRVTLDGAQALAYVRSRYYEELVDGSWRTDPTSDLGRVQRQRAFLQALLSKMASTKNPVALARLASAMGGGMRIDDRLTYLDALGLLWQVRGGFHPESLTLPVTNRTTSGGAAVLDLDTAQARPLISRFGG
jgi:LCP family protein required for cell wall assembly